MWECFETEGEHTRRTNRLMNISLGLCLGILVVQGNGAEVMPEPNGTLPIEEGIRKASSPASKSVLGLEERIDSIVEAMSLQEKIEQLYYKTDGNDRLGIPQFKGSDGPHGIGNKAKGWSCFPATLAMTATWEPDMIQKVGKAIALEQASRKRHRIAGPVLDLLHDPRNGRAPETIGEDPFLGGRITEAFLRGQTE